MMTHNLIIVTEISIEFATLDLHVMELSRVSPMSIIMLGAWSKLDGIGIAWHLPQHNG
jgi:hypothetical protein